MEFDFDIAFDRRTSKCRKWDNDLVSQNFGIEGDYIPMHIADMDFEVAPAILNAVVKRAEIPDYSYTYSYDDFFEAVVNWNKRRHHIDYKEQWIKLMFGTCGALRYAVQCFSKPDESVLINTPVYQPFAEAIEYSGREVVTSALKLDNLRYYFDFDDIERKIVDNKVRVYILCSPHNPGGRVWTKDELFKISEICLKHDVVLVSDEVHCEMVFEGNEFTTLWNAHPKIAENSIVCNSPNKAFNLGGLKSSYVVINNESMRNIWEKHMQKVYVTSPNVFIIPAVVAAYNESEEWLDQLTSYIDGNFKCFNEFMNKNFSNVDVMKVDASYLAWAYFGNVFKNDDEAKKFFINAKLPVVLGSWFVSDGDGWVRFNLGTQRKTLIDALSRLVK